MKIFGGLEPELLSGFVRVVDERSSDVVVADGDSDGSVGASGFACDLFDGFSCEELSSQCFTVAEFGIVGPHGC